MQAIFFNDFKNAYIPEQLKEMYRDRIYAQFLDGKKDLTILDVGGNIGIFSFYASEFAKQIYILEPAKQHQEVIETMLKYNKLDNKVTLVKKALSDKDGTTTFYHNENVTMFSMRPEVNGKPDDAETVETVTLDTLFTQYKIDHVDFMKRDVEGSEIDIVNSKGFEKVASKIDGMVIELHSWSGRNPSQLTTTLMDLGFEVFPIPNEAMLFGARRIK